MQPAKAKTLLKYVDQFPWRWSALMNKVLEMPFSLVGNLKSDFTVPAPFQHTCGDFQIAPCLS